LNLNQFSDILIFVKNKEVVNIKKLLMSYYLKLLKFINKKCDCLHRIIFVVSGVTGSIFFYFINQNSFIEAGLTVLIGGGLVELINKYLKSQPEIVLVTQSNEENDEEFLNKIQKKLTDTLKEHEEDNKK